jgi:hypothetical protein
MKTEEITIRVDPDAAKAYRAASDEDRRKLELLISMKLREATKSTGSLIQAMKETSRNAQERGLTPEILASLLHE